MINVDDKNMYYKKKGYMVKIEHMSEPFSFEDSVKVCVIGVEQDMIDTINVKNIVIKKGKSIGNFNLIHEQKYCSDLFSD